MSKKRIPISESLPESIPGRPGLLDWSLEERPKWRIGEPCNHPGRLHHITHPCEGCGRIAGGIYDSPTSKG